MCVYACVRVCMCVCVCGPFLDTKHPERHTLNFTVFFSFFLFLFFCFFRFKFHVLTSPLLSILRSPHSRSSPRCEVEAIDTLTIGTVREKVRNACQQKFAQTSNVIAGSSVPSSIPETRDSWR